MGKCGRDNGKGCGGAMDCGMGNTRSFSIRTGEGPGCCGGPNGMMMFNGQGPAAGVCPMMGDDKVDVIITNPEDVTKSKPSEKVTTTFEMPIWQRTVEFMKGNDANIKTFVDKVKADPELLKKLKEALNK
ncbi:MAG: hypothetical protein HGA95_05060, partial [Caldiserica bacterium]|nr:hypothetical protein [Caldisericota bacterium]